METHRRPEVKRALRREAIAMGRPCRLIDSASLSENVLVIVYKVAPFNREDSTMTMRYMHQIRCATYCDSKQMSSLVVRTWFSESEK